MPDFLTIPDELIKVAEAAIAYYEQSGYRVKIEWRAPGFPFVPAFVAVRRPSTIIVEVASDFQADRMQKWCRFGRSCSGDTQVTLFVPANSTVLSKLELIQPLHIGLCIANPAGHVQEILAPHDLAMIMDLPVLAEAKAAVRRVLGPAYEQIDRGHWREAFETACVALETEARRYLWRALSGGPPPRLTVLNKKGIPRQVKKKEVMKSTLGGVADLLNSTTPHNQMDALLATTIPLINRQRVDVAHFKYRREVALRKHVRQHMWAIYQCLEEML